MRGVTRPLQLSTNETRRVTHRSQLWPSLTRRAQAVQCGGLRLTRVRGVPFAGEALGFGALVGGQLARSYVATLDRRLSRLTGQS